MGTTLTQLLYVYSKNGSTLKRKNLVFLGYKLFPFTVHAFSERIWCAGPEVIKHFIVLNSAELCPANNSQITYSWEFCPAKYSVGIFIFISRENFMLSWAEQEESFITSGPVKHTGGRKRCFSCSVLKKKLQGLSIPHKLRKGEKWNETQYVFYV